MIIFDEYNYVENIIKSHEKPSQMGIRKLINYIAMYYYDDYGDGCLLGKYVNKVMEVMRDFEFPLYIYQEYIFVDYIKRICKKYQTGKLSHTLRDDTPVIITEQEIKVINQAPSEKHSKVLFTLYVIAKKISQSGWVNYSLKDIFDYADVRVKQDERHRIIYDLKEGGIIQINHIIDKTGYKVTFYPDSPTYMMVNSFEHCGNQYLSKYRIGWRMCEICGKMIKIKAPNHKYCKTCAKIVNIYKTKEKCS